MGGADIVPGVSGGTVALILGIYERLVSAISHFDLRLLHLVRGRQWRRAALHVDLPLLVPLATGILMGFIVMTVLMHFLLSTQTTRSLTMAMFFGLIFASGILVALMVRVRTRNESVTCLAIALAGAIFAWWIAGLNMVNGEAPPLVFIFLSGAVAICAMILPGISGAMILLVLGVYIHLTEIPGNLLHGQQVLGGLVTLLTFATGCALGLLTFSKILRWLLQQHHATTMALLCGFMFGSLRKLWPFQRDLTPHVEKVKFKTFEPMLPSQWDTHVTLVMLIFIVAVTLIWGADWFTHGHLRKLFGKRLPAR